MSDYDSSLPVRTEAAGDVDVFLSDALVPANKAEINGSRALRIFGSALDIRPLLFATDTVDVSGSLVTVQATALDVRPLTFATDAVDVSGSLVTVQATDLDIRNLVAATDSVAAHLFDEAGVAFSSVNPLPVTLTSDQDGDEICEYNTSAAVAKNASVNHDYTVTVAKTFLGEEAWISGSGKLKIELLVNGATKFVGFNSTSNPNVRIPLEKILKGAATEVIRMTITNRDNQPQDVYSTLLGLEIA